MGAMHNKYIVFVNKLDIFVFKATLENLLYGSVTNMLKTRG